MQVETSAPHLYPIFVRHGRSQRTAKAGFISADGQIAIPPIFDSVDWFFDGRAAACLDGKWGFVEESGGWVVEPRYVSQVRFSEGLAVCLVDAKKRIFEVIDASGDRLFELRHYLVSGFREGLAWIRTRDERSAFVNREGLMVTDFRFGDPLAPLGYVDRSGKWVIPPTFMPAGMFRGGLALVEDGTGFGYVNRAGSKVWWSKDLSIVLPFHLHRSWIW